MSAHRYVLFGGLEVVTDSGPLALGTRKQRAALAQLLLAGGQIVGIGRLIEGIWGEDAPDRAEASVQSFISGLRRALEPDRAPRAQPQLLVTRGTGYAVLAPRESVDVWHFTDLVERGRQLHDAGQLTEAGSVLRDALAEYAPLLPEFDSYPFQVEAAAHFERIHSAALELSYEIRLDLGEARMLAADLEAGLNQNPLHEGLWYLLAVARYRMGRQSEALAALADCRRVLADEIGVDPSPRIRQLERDILSQAPHLDGQRRSVRVPNDPTNPSAAEDVSSPEPAGQRDDRPDPDPALLAANAVAEPTHALIGRLDELAILHDAVVTATGGGDAIVLVEGPSGAGKTALLDEVTRRAHAHGRIRTLWGRCVEGEGAPAMWPWVQILGQALPDLDDDYRAELLDTELGRMVISGATVVPPPVIPDVNARFRLFDQAADLLEGVAEHFSLIIVMDDVQWADARSLELLVHIAARRPNRAMFVGSLRTDANLERNALKQALAALSRLPSHRRLQLGPLARDEVGELIRQETGIWPSADLVRAIDDRTEGNPFYTRELARLLRDSGKLDHGVDVSGVPSGVLDVVRGRLAGISETTTELLQVGSLIGKQIDLELLSAAAGLDIEQTLDGLEPAESLHVVEPIPADPFAVRFTHDLMREAIAETVPAARARRVHLRIADALAAGGGDADRVERLAHHLWSAGPLAPRERTAQALVDAARIAMARFAYETAERQAELGAELAAKIGARDLELDGLIVKTAVVSIRQGYVGVLPGMLEHAEQLAVALGRDREAVEILYGRWSALSQQLDLGPSSELSVRLNERAAGASDPVIRLYALHAEGVTHWDHGRIGESYRALLLANEILAREIEPEPALIGTLRHDVKILAPAFLAYMTMIHLGVEAGRARFAELARRMGEDRYAVIAWSAFAASAASMAGDAESAERSGAFALTGDAAATFEFLGTYSVFQYWWARAMHGDTEEGIEQMRIMLDRNPDLRRTGYALWLTLFAEAHLVAGALDEAGAALEQADKAIRENGQRYPEPVTRLMHARLAHARGLPREQVAEILRAARDLAAATESTVPLDRITAFAAENGYRLD
ncbi:AAA family ATPase [Aldersonia sp. NBC_00410]|uniref:ATP-binding protein n=1 Tax=Aldersonia sp. NBC_00410 TaxID=2975954 RepID=UPI0022541E89|nr:BTAD domain-containing putative transcriptional regulator [Aldersonia sp. NBC_00410]MCX5043583.1 AAA family ATPase [Aldersonia sp. NBC_00410]